jgi:hypothetical protein
MYAKDPNSTASGMEIGRSEDGSTFTSCATGQTINTSFAQLSCTFTTGATSGSTFIYIRDANSRTNAAPFYVDTAQLYTGTATSAAAFQNGTVSLNGVINSPTSFKNQSDSTTAFQIQNASAGVLLLADTSNNRIQIGSSTTDSTGVLLTLDSYNQSGDPTNTVNGTMYYNTNTSKFRCYQGGAWTNCISSTLSSYTILTSTSANSTYTVPSGVSTIMVEMIGSGGAGGSSAGSTNNAGAGGGGGAGAYGRKIVTSLAASYKYTIGTGGTAGGTGNNSGGNGNPTCFGTNNTACTTPTITCAGGNGGSGSGVAGTTNVSSNGGTGGTCTSADVTYAGAAGGNGSRWLGTAALSGYGAGTTFGSGGSAIGISGTGGAASSGSYGAGGGGGCSIGNTNSQGGAGQQGVIIIWEFK